MKCGTVSCCTGDERKELKDILKKREFYKQQEFEVLYESLKSKPEDVRIISDELSQFCKRIIFMFSICSFFNALPFQIEWVRM